MSRYPFKKNYIPFYTKMTFIEKKNISCKNNIGIRRNLEIKFHDENCYNYNNITFRCILQSYISSMNEVSIFNNFKTI